jgi:outer membrane receptor protein involved in Fe transport
VNCLMIKRVLTVVLGLLSLSLPLAAQAADDEVIWLEQLRDTGALDVASALTLSRPDVFSTNDGSIFIHGLSALTLLDGRRFPISNAMTRMGLTPLDLFPVAFLSAVEVQKAPASPIYGSDATGGVVNLRLKEQIYAGGEIGFFYGRSGGKYDREDIQSYIIGGVGNEKFNITVGAAYQESSGHIPRLQPVTPPN